MGLSRRVAGYDHVLLDLDGCVWVGDEPTPGRGRGRRRAAGGGRGLAFVTNDGRHGEEDVVRKLWRLGFQAAEGGGRHRRRRASSSSAPSADWRSAVVIGAPAIHRHVADAGLRDPQRRRPGPGGRRRRRRRARRASATPSCARRRAGAAARRRAGGRRARPTFPMPDGPWPGTGAGRGRARGGLRACTARNVGKPEPDLFRTALDRLGPGRALVVGDRAGRGRRRAPARRASTAPLVLTGATTRGRGRRTPSRRPHSSPRRLAELVLA